MIRSMFTLSLFVFSILQLRGVAFAEEPFDPENPKFVPLSGNLPLLNDPNTVNVADWANALFGISVGTAAILAVIMLSIGGFRYMTSDSVFNLGDAKQQMTSAVIGLLIVLTAFLLLRYINPDIVSLNLF